MQGLGGAMMVPVGRLVLLRIAPRHELVRALAYLTVPALIGPLIGPPLGGFIATYFDWRYIFWINVPIGFLGIALVTRFIPDLREESVRRSTCEARCSRASACPASSSASPSLGRGFAPVPVVALIIGVGAASLIVYVRHARRTATSDHRSRSFAHPDLSARRSVGGFLFRIGLGATPFLLPLLLQVGFGLSASGSGLTDLRRRGRRHGDEDDGAADSANASAFAAC